MFGKANVGISMTFTINLDCGRKHGPGVSKDGTIIIKHGWRRFIIRATSHTRLRACGHYTLSTLIGGKGRAGPSLLYTTLEGPTEYVNARWMQSLHGFLHGIEWLVFHGHLDYLFIHHLFDVGLTQNSETMARLVDIFFSALTISWSRLLALVWSGPKWAKHDMISIIQNILVNIYASYVMLCCMMICHTPITKQNKLIK